MGEPDGDFQGVLMPVTLLTMTSVIARNGWIVPINNANYLNAINSDDPTSGGSNTTTFPLNVNGSYVLCAMSDLPIQAAASNIISLITKHTSRRSGGSTAGQYRVIFNSAALGTNAVGAINQPGAPGPPGIRIYFEDFTFIVPSPETRWTYTRINEVRSAWVFGPSVGTGMSVYYIGPSVTWTEESGGLLGELIGVSWLPPLIAWLGGANLFSENMPKMCFYLSEFFEGKKIRNYPAFGLPREREELCWKLFRRPRFCFMGAR